MIFDANKGVRATDAPSHGLGNDTKSALGQFKVKAALSAGDVIPIVAVPRGAVIIRAVVETDGTLAGGNFSLGDDTNPVCLGTGIAPNSQVFCKHYKFTEKSTVLNLKAGTAPTGTGTLLVTVQYIVD